MTTTGALPSFQDLLDRETVAVPECLRINTSPEIPQVLLTTDRWTDAAFAALEADRLWSRTWQMVCRESALTEAGDFLVYDISRYSVLLVRTESGQLRGYHNSCLHRGRALKSGRGRSREIRCPYHGFCWHLDGSFKEAFCSEEFSGQALENLSLPEVQTAVWGGWVFINMDLQAPNFSDYAGLLDSHFGRWQPEQRRVLLRLGLRTPVLRSGVLGDDLLAAARECDAHPLPDKGEVHFWVEHCLGHGASVNVMVEALEELALRKRSVALLELVVKAFGGHPPPSALDRVAHGRRRGCRAA